mgnify:CR=1 FL=1
MRSGNNGLFIPGPTNLPHPLRFSNDLPLKDQRAPDFPNLTLGLFEDLKRIFKLNGGRRSHRGSSLTLAIQLG